MYVHLHPTFCPFFFWTFVFSLVATTKNAAQQRKLQEQQITPLDLNSSDMQLQYTVVHVPPLVYPLFVILAIFKCVVFGSTFFTSARMQTEVYSKFYKPLDTCTHLIHFICCTLIQLKHYGMPFFSSCSQQKHMQPLLLHLFLIPPTNNHPFAITTITTSAYSSYIAFYCHYTAA